jgi:hypothetical protein
VHTPTLPAEPEPRATRDVMVRPYLKRLLGSLAGWRVHTREILREQWLEITDTQTGELLSMVGTNPTRREMEQENEQENGEIN